MIGRPAEITRFSVARPKVELDLGRPFYLKNLSTTCLSYCRLVTRAGLLTGFIEGAKFRVWSTLGGIR